MRVTLLNWTPEPIETVLAVWEAAKSDEAFTSMAEIRDRLLEDEDYAARAVGLFCDVVEMEIPVARFIHFVFLVEDMTVSFREQLVRHKAGLDLWLQSDRVRDLSHFAERKQYTVPASIQADPEAAQAYAGSMMDIEATYRDLCAEGIPFEDARELLPSGRYHRGSIVVNLAALLHICRKRTCWIAQWGHWREFIQGMVEALVVKVDPVFEGLASPPCFGGGCCYGGCKYNEILRRRNDGDEDLAVCPLWWATHPKERRTIANLQAEGRWDAQRMDQALGLWPEPVLRLMEAAED